jgi:SPP1 family predicted phage head-tail adaptor
MQAGRLRNRVIFQKATPTSDDGGGFAVTWGEDVQRWAEFLVERGSERIEAGRISAEMSGILRLREDEVTASITPQYRAVIDGEMWNIRSVSNEDRRHRMLTMVVERGPAT